MNKDSTKHPHTDFDDTHLSSLTHMIGEAVVQIDHSWQIRYCNDVYLSAIAMTKDQVIGKSLFECQPNLRRSIFFNSIERCAREVKPVSKIGYSTIFNRWLMVRIFPVDGDIVLFINDANEDSIKQEHLAAQATKDRLTGLRNKLGMTCDLERLIQLNQPFCLILMGLDRFRSVNDTLGYAGGDMALLEVASRLQSATQDGEDMYRLSADEFVIVRKQGDNGASDRFNQFTDVSTAPITLHGHSFVLGLSAGTACYPGDGALTEELVRRASLALHRAKNSERGCLVAYTSGLEVESQLKSQLETELRDAIRSNKLHLVFQPKGDMPTGILTGAEALIRWNHPKRGLLSPAAFLPLAQECGLMKDIDHFVLKQAISTLASWKRLDIECCLSINLSVDSLCDKSLITQVKSALEQADVAPGLLEIEIPEGTLMHDITSSIKTLNALRDMGVIISVDDFGTGYSSISYLAKFPVHTLKIDRMFITNLETDIPNQKIVKAIIRMAHSLGLDVVAEGVETLQQLQKLRKLQCNTVQGYFYARPLTYDDFLAFVATHHKTPISGPLTCDLL